MKRGGERLARLEDGKRDGEGRWGNESGRNPYAYAPATDLARQWHGWGTALKPAWEPIIVARKPLVGTVAANVTEWGTGAINVDGCRVEGDQWTRSTPYKDDIRGGAMHAGKGAAVYETGPQEGNPSGRWPANFIHDGSDEVVGLMPESKDGVAGARTGKHNGYGGGYGAQPDHKHGYGGEGSAARFFYCPKASKADRNEGCDNRHPTVKPTALMAYLCRLVTQPGGLILDPFCGSGSTGKAAVSEGFRFVGIEREAEYVEIAERRVSAAVPADLFAEATP